MEPLVHDILSLESGLSVREKTDRPAVQVGAGSLFSLLEKLKNDDRFAFDMLVLHTAIDWPTQGKIELIYLLSSTKKNHSVQISSFVERTDAVVPTVSTLWKIAEWQEREVFDLFGIKYSAHPDLRRILLEDDWTGHPLLKDYKDDFMLERPW